MTSFCDLVLGWFSPPEEIFDTEFRSFTGSAEATVFKVKLTRLCSSFDSAVLSVTSGPEGDGADSSCRMLEVEVGVGSGGDLAFAAVLLALKLCALFTPLTTEARCRTADMTSAGPGSVSFLKVRLVVERGGRVTVSGSEGGVETAGE